MAAGAIPVLKAVGSWLAGSGGTAAAAAAASTATGSLLAPSGPDAPKVAEAPVPDDKRRRAGTERRLARAYADRGSVASAFGRDKLG